MENNGSSTPTCSSSHRPDLTAASPIFPDFFCSSEDDSLSQSEYQSMTTGSVSPFLFDAYSHPPLYLGNFASNFDISLASNSTLFASGSFIPSQATAVNNVNHEQNFVFANNDIFRAYSTPSVTHRIHKSNTTCDICGKQVAQKNLKSHLETHEPFRDLHACGACGCCYFHLRDLTSHQAKKHDSVILTNDRHICGFCGVFFAENQMLKYHRRYTICSLF